MAVGIALLCFAGLWLFLRDNGGSDARTAAGPRTDRGPLTPVQSERPSRMMNVGQVSLWWDGIPQELQAKLDTSPDKSNIRSSDYAGPDACRKCHPGNHADWYGHSHRLMNASATQENVAGDFSPAAEIRYLGGRGEFFRSGDSFRMKLSRAEHSHEFEIHQTIGSRFFQYYIGSLIEGPFPAEHPYRRFDQVLPFGYWLDRKEWVPVVHLNAELPDGKRTDPFVLPERPRVGFDIVPYSLMCNTCHTTFPLGDSLIRKPNLVGKFAPGEIHFDYAGYIQEMHPGFMPAGTPPELISDPQFRAVGQVMSLLDASEHAATLGISCEACHLGCAEHVKDPRTLPPFFPRSPHLIFPAGKSPQDADSSAAAADTRQSADSGRHSIEDLNWICSRCHNGHRPQLAAGMATWNSTEFSDAARGSCYSRLRCIDCHPPHKGIGHSWQRTAAEDDASCLRCHEQLGTEQALTAHTHHPAGSAGSHCMNCHMPRLNEGLQDVVRTHMIFSPVEASMIESGQPNACNICHTRESISWTRTYLKDWYGKSYADEKIQQSYPDP
ncbi:MAG: ammonia-forming cytochrome c nitrite reductase subunit c552, partial [Planctomycetaceae bacterium]